MSSKSSVPIITHPENEYRWCPPQPDHTRSRRREEKNSPLVDLIVKAFQGIPEDRILLGSLEYPTLSTSYRSNIHADLFHFFQRVLRHVPRRRTWCDPQFQRQFFIEKNEDAGRHAHFILEVPSGMSPEEMMEITRDTWRQIALRERRETEYWARLNRGIRLHPAQPRSVLVQDHTIPTLMYAPDRIVRDSTSYRKLAVVKPVTTEAGGLRGAVNYCLKWEGLESADRSGEMLLEKSTAKWIRGHSPSLSLQ